MRLIDSPRSTTDIDYVFVPYESKKDVRKQIEAVLAEIVDAEVSIDLHSKMLRAEIRLDDAAIQLEVSVALHCPSSPMSTGGFAIGLGQPAHVVRIMSAEWALANKLAAWNERRIMRDLYDCYFYTARLGAFPELQVLEPRLAKIRSRLPILKRKKSMTKLDLAAALRKQATELSTKALKAELGGLLPPEELSGLDLRMRSATVRLAEWLERESTSC